MRRVRGDIDSISRRACGDQGACVHVHVRACMQACSATRVRYGCGCECVHPWAAKRCAPCLTTSKIAAMRHACRTVSTPAPTEVPNALAMSLAPITKPSMIADPMPTATIHVLHARAHVQSSIALSGSHIAFREKEVAPGQQTVRRMDECMAQHGKHDCAHTTGVESLQGISCVSRACHRG
jgi:hypothetical protein